VAGAKETIDSALLPPHGKLLYQLDANSSDFTKAPLRNSQDKIAANGSAFDFTAASDGGPVVTLPVNGIGDFVAGLKIMAVSRRASVRLRFHGYINQPGDYVVQFPAWSRLAPPASGARPLGQHTCCQDFDMYSSPGADRPTSIFTGPQPFSVPAAANEELTVAVSVKGPLIVAYANGKEIARASDSTFGPGAMRLQILPAGPDQAPAVARLNALEVYEPSTGSST